jgi:hypothetical protein
LTRGNPGGHSRPDPGQIDHFIDTPNESREMYNQLTFVVAIQLSHQSRFPPTRFDLNAEVRNSGYAPQLEHDAFAQFGITLLLVGIRGFGNDILCLQNRRRL